MHVSPKGTVQILVKSFHENQRLLRRIVYRKISSFLFAEHKKYKPYGTSVRRLAMTRYFLRTMTIQASLAGAPKHAMEYLMVSWFVETVALLPFVLYSKLRRGLRLLCVQIASTMLIKGMVDSTKLSVYFT